MALATVIGVAIGITELISRYRDAPFKATFSVPGLLYFVVNGSAAASALALIREFDVVSPDEPIPLKWVLAAGFGAMAILRSSLFSFRAGDQDVALGPSTLLRVVLDAADREVDRQRAKARAASVDEIMRDVVFEKAQLALPTYCLALLQNLSQEDQDQLARMSIALKDAQMNERVKNLSLGLAIMDAVGEDVLRVTVDTLGQDIRAGTDIP